MVWRMRRMKRTALAAVLCAAALCGGCGIREKNSNISEGMAAIEELRYEDALACFEKALVAGEVRQLILWGQ